MSDEKGFAKWLSCCRSMKKWEWVLAVVLSIIPMIGGFVGAATMSTSSYRKNWFKQPDWAPPSWLFGPVWTILYFLMGLCSFLIWKCGGGLNRDTIPPLIIYVLQLLINWAWSPIFFGQGMFSLAEMFLAAIWALCIACIITYFPISKVASILMFPYLVWLSFAGALNNTIVYLNGPFLNHTMAAGNGTAGS